jgi:AcrR family transcriptional regulator
MPSKPLSRKEIILDRAEHHFAEHGFQGGSLSAIARDCDVGNPGLLHHFPSKEKLYRAVLEKQAEALMLRMRKHVEAAAGLEARLQAFVDLQVEWMHARPTGFKLITRELLDNSERVTVAQTRPLEGFLLDSLSLLSEAQAAGLVRGDLSAVALLTVILGTLNYAKIVRPTFNEAFAHRELKSDKQWMRSIAQDILRLVSPAGAAAANPAAA